MVDLYLVTLRAIHVLTAVFWAGGTFLLAMSHEFVLNPGRPEETLERMAEYDNMSKKVGFSGIFAVLSGLLLYWEVSGHLSLSWIMSPYGMTITVGAIAGLASMAVAVPMLGMTNNRVSALYEETQGNDTLTDDQRREVTKLEGRLKRGERGVAILLAIAALAMGVAQYV